MKANNKAGPVLDSHEHRELRSEIVQLLYDSSTRSMLVAFLVAATLIYVESDVVSSDILRSWGMLFIVVYGLRQLLTIAYQRQTDRSRKTDLWLNCYRVTTAACGLSWGLAAFYFYQANDIGHQAFIIFILVGVSGGAIIVYSIDSICANLFAGGLYLLSLPRFLTDSSTFSIAMALMLGLYIIYVSMAGASLARKLRENILLRIAGNRHKQEINTLAQRQKQHIDLTPMGVIECSSDLRITSWNAAAEKIFGYSHDEATGRTLDFILPLIEREKVMEMLKDLFQRGTVDISQFEHLHRDGDIIYCEWYFTPLKDTDGEVIGLASLVQDKTAFKKGQEEIHFLAYYDLLTALPNRRLLMDNLERAIISSKRTRAYGAVLFIDLDNFKNVNDLQGHATGDLLLKEVSQRLKKTVRGKDTIARFGGDEFVLILEDLSQNLAQAISSSRAVVNKIIDSINQPYTFAEHDYHTSCSIGICLFTGDELSISEILKRADIAMFQAKQAGRNCMQLFDESLQPKLEFRAGLESDLRGASFNVELLPYYQPQIGPQGQILGAELLLRWLHPRHGMVSPAEFIPIAEESSLINTIGHAVLDHACHQLKAWQADESTRGLRLSVNISTRQFSQSNFIEQVSDALRDHNCPANLLRLEITESLMLKNIEELVEKMLLLKKLGVSLSLDDFGTGYSSLSVLRRFPLNELKIDRSFVADMLSNQDDAVITQTIIAMGKNLGLEVIAEGVESHDQVAFLQKTGCQNFQGYLFGKPVPLAEFEQLLSSKDETPLHAPRHRYTPVTMEP